jgi:hypothetical protein
MRSSFVLLFVVAFIVVSVIFIRRVCADMSFGRCFVIITVGIIMFDDIWLFVIVDIVFIIVVNNVNVFSIDDSPQY